MGKPSRYRFDTACPPFARTFIEQVIQDAKALERREWRVMALVGMLPYVPDKWYQEMTREPLEMARGFSNKTERVLLLVRILPYVETNLYGQVCEEALAAARQIDEQAERVEALTALAPLLAELPVEVLVRLWRESLHSLALRTRKDILSDIHAMQLVITRLWGNAGLVAVAQAVLDAGRWFT